jgi:hypothetical protein
MMQKCFELFGVLNGDTKRAHNFSRFTACIDRLLNPESRSSRTFRLGGPFNCTFVTLIQIQINDLFKMF